MEAENKLVAVTVDERTVTITIKETKAVLTLTPSQARALWSLLAQIYGS